MKSELSKTVLKLTAILIAATLGAFVVCAGGLWLLVHLLVSLADAWWAGNFNVR